MRPVDPRLLREAPAARRFVLLAGVLGVVGAVATVAQAVALGLAVDHAFLQHRRVGGELAVFAVTTAVRAAVAWLLETGGRRTAVRVAASLRRRLVAHLIDARPRDVAVGELAAAAVTGLDALGPYFGKFLPQLVLSCAVPAIVFAWVVWHDLTSALVMALTLPLIPVFGILVGKVTEQRTLRRFRTLGVLSSYFVDVVRGLPTLRAFNRTPSVADVSEAYRRETMSTLRIGFLSALVLELAATISTAVIAVEIGLRLVDGGIALAPALAVLVLAPEFYGPLRAAAAQFHASADGLAAAGRVFELLDLPPAVRAPERPLPVPDLRRATIRFEALGLHYAGRDEPALSGLDAAIGPGERVAIGGPSGAGKTTLLEIVLRLLDQTSGRITVDGVDLRELDPTAWHRGLAWLPQRPQLPAGTVRAALGGPAIADERLERALAQAGAGFARLDDVLGERTPLSFGEIRRLAFARTLARDAALLVLDEPTTHLDAGAAQIVIDAIGALPETTTVLVATHDPRLLAACDRVVALAPVEERQQA
ncbi:MAG: thiol reductant ABC exporter subunit CydD [Actinomycetota bacterium]